MSLKSEIEEVRHEVKTIVGMLEELNRSSTTIPQTDMEDLSAKLTGLIEQSVKVSVKLGTTTEKLKGIKSRWG
jgi:ElaB/YqjD/DUF883 family membrane-anchored ribosome-binding protein